MTRKPLIFGIISCFKELNSQPYLQGSIDLRNQTLTQIGEETT